MKFCSICTIPHGEKPCGHISPMKRACNRFKGHTGDHAHCANGIHPVEAWISGRSVDRPVEAPNKVVRHRDVAPVVKPKPPAKVIHPNVRKTKPAVEPKVTTVSEPTVKSASKAPDIKKQTTGGLMINELFS